jgi:hypothetical protein
MTGENGGGKALYRWKQAGQCQLNSRCDKAHVYLLEGTVSRAIRSSVDGMLLGLENSNPDICVAKITWTK